MSAARAGKTGRGPAPVRAGASLLVHDLKNLAGRLAVLCRNLDDHYDDPLFKRSALAVLDDTVGHLRRLAGDLREHEERVIIKLRVDLNDVLADALRETRADRAGNIRLEEDRAPLPTIWGDAYLLRRAFACAIENALQAMGGRGVLRVSTGLGRSGTNPRAWVEIGDNGPGMTEEFLRERLFQPFATTKKDGLGLGVYTIRQVAGIHGGRVRIASERGAGTRVRFAFPTGD